jgi:hypothetical protein
MLKRYVSKPYCTLRLSNRQTDGGFRQRTLANPPKTHPRVDHGGKLVGCPFTSDLRFVLSNEDL